MTDVSPLQAPVDAPHQPVGAPVGGHEPASVATGAMARMLQRIDDPGLRLMLESHKGGQFARAVAGELDMLHAMIVNQGPERAPALMTDLEATALEQWLHQHFAITGRPPEPRERLVNRVMLTLHGLVQQLQEHQSTLADRQQIGTPVR